MKRNLLILLLLFLSFETLYAQFSDGLFMYGGTVSGPIKQITIIIRQHHDPTDVQTDVARFDSIGRIVQTAFLKNRKMVIDHTYNYIDKYTCWRYDYDENGHKTNQSQKICFDSEGREIVKLSYSQNKIWRVDSLVYDERGNLVEKYASSYGQNIPLLEITYSYDSIGRLINEYNVKQKKGYTVTYLNNGNYIKHFSEKNKIYTEKCNVNKDGHLIKEENEERIVKYLSYDKYGNWLKREVSYKHDNIGSTTERIIEYYEE